jgi:hypothetical protein
MSAQPLASQNLEDLAKHAGTSEELILEMYKIVKAWDAHIASMPQLRDTVIAVSIAQTRIATAIDNMAEIYRKSEERSEKQEGRYQELTKLALGKDQVPLRSHYWTLAAALIPTMVMGLGSVLAVLYITKVDLKASLSEIQVIQGERAVLEGSKN